MLSKGLQHGVVSNFVQKEIDIAGINMPVQVVPDDDQRLSYVEDILEAGERDINKNPKRKTCIDQENITVSTSEMIILPRD